jgi:hypothetical protein
MLETSSSFADWIQRRYPAVLQSIMLAEKEKGVEGPDYMEPRLGSTTIQSLNLINAAHFDVNDKSRCVALFTETMPNDARGWNFVMPNLSYKGSKGVAIPLSHGTVLS